MLWIRDHNELLISNMVSTGLLLLLQKSVPCFVQLEVTKADGYPGTAVYDAMIYMESGETK